MRVIDVELTNYILFEKPKFYYLLPVMAVWGFHIVFQGFRDYRCDEVKILQDKYVFMSKWIISDFVMGT